jgi:hypothetical protein
MQKHYPRSLRDISKTRLAVRINAIKQTVEYLSNIRVNMEEMGIVTLQPHASNDISY